MGDHARLAFRPRRLAICSGPRRPAWCGAQRKGTVGWVSLRGWARIKWVTEHVDKDFSLIAFHRSRRENSARFGGLQAKLFYMFASQANTCPASSLNPSVLRPRDFHGSQRR